MERSRYQDRLEKLFGPMDPKLRNSVSTPNDMSRELASMCRSMATTSRLEMWYLVDYLVADWRGGDPRDFANFLYGTSRDPVDWNFAKTLLCYPEINKCDWSSVSVERYLKSLAGTPGERWYSVRLKAPSIYADRNEVGTIMRNVRYYEGPQLQGIGCSQMDSPSIYVDLIHLTDAEVPIAIRRLLAKRLGREAKALLLEPNATITVDELVRAANIDAATMSADAKQALEAIVVEMNGVGGTIDKADRCVGEGPDYLYR
jgi:hypothetical protein